MSGKGAKKAPKKKGANGYKLPDPIPNGEILTDVAKKRWIIGPSIGVGGFGEIYSAASYTDGKSKTYPYVIKIEPHENGPLFVEMHFYMRNAKPTDIESWKRERKLPFLGMPSYIGSGSHECHNTKYRFVVMERFGKNLWDIFLENNRIFPEHRVYNIALQIIDVLEYMHNKSYVHADIKGANLLQSLKSTDHNYLVDFGLASHYTNKTEYKPDPKKTHNGTIEYTSRDMHMGIPTMRGDFEILGYNMIQWLCGSLPWEKNLTEPLNVQKQKEKAFEDIPQFLKKCFSNTVPESIFKFMKLINVTKFNESPNYAKFKDILIRGLKDIGHKPGERLGFSASSTVSKLLVTPGKIKKPATEVLRKSPRMQKTRSPSPVSNALNDSDLGSLIISSRKGKRVQDKRRILKNIEVTDDSDTEIEIKIKRKKKNKKDENSEVVNKDIGQKPLKRITKKSQKQYDPDETVSDDETQIQGTKSRPKVITKPKKKLIESEESLVENNSDEDMFGDDDEDVCKTSSKKPAKSWRDAPTVKSSNTIKPGEYKSVNKSKTPRNRRGNLCS
ncbi:serine/threonine-protein kinase VRK1-like isoform X1 [Neodiprion fabricii]|uniref:serine/threonine-protein kinase VRK1-like isoform X1 n=1 Tax=Neodiprion fabricii TaxID=2872261 RepID=UPI001ED8D405|nr:serine/threonine-protein kinase VRK1-like isoform X1 [Neodiprion fabricii]